MGGIEIPDPAYGHVVVTDIEYEGISPDDVRIEEGMELAPQMGYVERRWKSPSNSSK